MAHTDTRPRLSDIAQEEILFRIRSGELAVGTRLPSEPELAQQMGISRGILREALNALQTRGYITRTPRGGSHIARPEASMLTESMVKGLMDASLAELIDFREALEQYAAQVVLARVSDDDIGLLREAALFDQQHDVYGCRDYHHRLAELAGMRLVSQFIDFYFERVSMLVDPDKLKAKPRKIVQDHERIMAALEKRSPRTLHSAIRRHFRNIRKYYQLI